MFDQENQLDSLTLTQEELDQAANATLSRRNSTQAQLEMLYSKYQLIPCITEYFCGLGAQNKLEDLGIPADFGINLLVQMSLHLRADIPTLVGLLWKHFKKEEHPYQACADMIYKAIAEDVVDMATLIVPDDESGEDAPKHMVVVRYTLPEDLQAKINQFQYPLPMVAHPLPVTNNKQTGYFTIRGSMILRNNHHDEDICLDHINRMNDVKLSINADVVAFIQNKWRNLDKPKTGEGREKFLRRKKAFEKYDQSSKEVIEGILAEGNEFWLTHRYDKRGRTYSQGYHISYQAADWNKACIGFAHAERLNEE